MDSQNKNNRQFNKWSSPFRYLNITILGFALTALWSSLHGIILPIRLLDFVSESQKNTYLGLLTFAGLVLAIIVQPVVGACSDCTNTRWGRRRPYILLGTLASIILLPGIGLAGTYVSILLVYCLLQVGSNTTQASYQALLPELVPEGMRGLASGVKSLLEVLGGVALTRLCAYFMGNYYAGGGESYLWISLYALMGVIFIAMIVTLLTVKQPPSFGGNRLSFSLIFRSLKVDFKVHPDFAWFLVSRALLGLPGVALQIFAIYYLMDVVGMENPAAVAGDLLVVVGVCLIATAYPAGRISDRIGRRPIVLVSGMLGAAGVLVLFLSRNYMQVMISGALLGVANGAMLSATWALATDLAVKGEEAKYLGITNLAMAGGSAVARLIGPVIDFFNGFRQGSGYQVMLFICFVCFIVGGLLVLKIKGDRASEFQKEND